MTTPAPHHEYRAAHPQSPSAKWAKYLAGIAEATRRAAGEREAQDRERHDATEYHRVAERTPTTKGAP